MHWRSRASWLASAACIASCCVAQSRVLPSMSVKRNVTVPVGGGAGLTLGLEGMRHFMTSCQAGGERRRCQRLVPSTQVLHGSPCEKQLSCHGAPLTARGPRQPRQLLAPVDRKDFFH